MFNREVPVHDFGWVKSAYTALRCQNGTLNGTEDDFRRCVMGNKDSLKIMAPVYYNFPMPRLDLQDEYREHFVLALFVQDPLPRAFYFDPAHQEPDQNAAYNHLKDCVEQYWDVTFIQMPQEVSNEFIDIQERNDYCGYHVMHLGRHTFMNGMPFIDPAFNIDLKKLEIDNQLKAYQAQRKAVRDEECEETIDRLTNP
uniref:Uncharacterized protein n=1 Tax=Panagrolaimus davidi TaxID=227884 RepID=A0A914PFW9_9BILA